MNLFDASGVALPKPGQSARSQYRAPRIPLLNYKVVREARTRVVFAPTERQRQAALDYAKKAASPKFQAQKETSIREIFVQDILQEVLGYRGFSVNAPYTLVREKAIRRGSVDVALGTFSGEEKQGEVIAPFELKGPDTKDLDAIMSGRGKSPVQQAWEYAIDAPGSRWVLVSNCLTIRLYGFGRGRDAYEEFDLTRLDEEEEHARLWLILAADKLLGGATDELLRATDTAAKDITNELYVSYKSLRAQVMQFLIDAPEGPKLSRLAAIEPAQKLLDRILFIAFCEGTGLLPEHLLKNASETQNKFIPQPIWMNFRALFHWVDKGNAGEAIPEYNGGLFAPDPVIDVLVIPDPLATDLASFRKWDYRSEVPVTVLGHIFEQSITDLEKLKAESIGAEPPTAGKRKREGVVYTPDVVTRFLVEQTLGRTTQEQFDALWQVHDMGRDPPPPPEQETRFWLAYLAVLRGLKVVDPACGSGAFLVAAFDVLAADYRRVTTRLETLGAAVDFDFVDEIVTKNLYGVDLNAESVEITRLSLWLKTARRDHRLQNLDATIKVGNSLIEDTSVSDFAFAWRAQFADVFAHGGFDIVLGNPPYVRMEYLKPIKPYLETHYVVASDRADLYAYFFERGVKLLKSGGRLGFVSSSTFFRTGSGENLRRFLSDGVAVESIVDFGDLQIFEGVTTYPAILSLRVGGEEPTNQNISYLKLTNTIPTDLGQTFLESAQTMPRARLDAGAWRLEDDRLARLRDKIAKGRKTLGDVYGAPLRGVVTGLNEAFVIDRAPRDALVKADPKSAHLLKPFLRGENVKRWRVESDDLWLINTPKGLVDIEAYPAIRNWLLPFKDDLEKRATQQAWWELQQAQLAYQAKLESPKIVWPHFQIFASFVLEDQKTLINNKSFLFRIQTLLLSRF